MASEYRAANVDLGDTFDCDLFGVTFVRRLRKLFHRVDAPRDWDLIVMTKGRTRHIGIMRYGRVRHNHGVGASGAVVSDDLGYIKRIYHNVTYWRLNDHSTLLPDRLGRDD
ncbi:NLPC/P60 domain endopeptidase [Vibrio phage 13VV501A]|nr:NLPC/P60 domain endopeptidase [Vibrio phage 13VV501A]